MLGAGVCSMASPASLTAGTSSRPRRAPAAAADGAVHGNAGQPGCEPGRPAELIEVQYSVDVSLLHHVFHVAIVAQDGANGPIQTLVVAADQNLVKRHLATANAVDDRFVGQLIRCLREECVFHQGLPLPIRARNFATGSRNLKRPRTDTA